MRNILFLGCGLMLCLSVAAPAFAAQNVPSDSAKVARYVPSASNLKARQEFREAGFGIFLHWGIYSMAGRGEWMMNNDKVNREEYAKLAEGFYPAHFNAREWVRLFKQAGAKYICFTARHHDGFSMFATKQTKYNIVDATPYKRDIVAELAIFVIILPDAWYWRTLQEIPLQQFVLFVRESRINEC